ncbi:DcrB-related protein [Pasteurellaceae bacterium LIM206]|nr:DcrB-related protein [Pasteurellaceae bacterium LIM206]
MFYFNEGSLNIGDEWQDSTLNILSTKSDVSITIARENIPFGMTFADFAEREFDSIGKQLKGYRQSKRSTLQIDNLEAVLSEFNWSSPQGDMYQMSIILNTPSHPLVLTASSLKPIVSSQREQLLAIFNTFKVRQPN